MYLKKSTLLSIFLGTASLWGAPSASLQPGSDFSIDEVSQDIAINNRILLKVNGESISVLDVVKKMDLLFYRQYPQYVSSSMARYQFYLASWRTVFQMVIDDQLILADATEKKVEISDGDIREELEDIFGPDVVLNIDKNGLTYDEAWSLLKKELIVTKMNNMMIRSRAINEVTPKVIREYYEAFSNTHPPEELWVYQLLSIRGSDEEKVNELAARAYDLAAISQLPLSAIVERLQEEGIQVSLSEEYSRKTKELSSAHKEILEALGIGSVSQPVMQMGKKEMAARLFFLKEHSEILAPAFATMKGQIQSELTQKAIARCTVAYLEKLRDYYGITEAYVAEMIPKDFQPFTLR